MCSSKSIFFCIIHLEGNKIRCVVLFYELGKTGRQFIYGVIWNNTPPDTIGNFFNRTRSHFQVSLF